MNDIPFCKDCHKQYVLWTSTYYRCPLCPNYAQLVSSDHKIPVKTSYFNIEKDNYDEKDMATN